MKIVMTHGFRTIKEYHPMWTIFKVWYDFYNFQEDRFINFSIHKYPKNEERILIKDVSFSFLPPFAVPSIALFVLFVT